ncbi:MAG: hypothetical protein JXA30_22035 [Deltaproteobacteria bacterium]|nr:hypothetical protein [Deltaproteobacteria bacterium]
MRPQITIVVVLLAAAAGFCFAAVSTYDSIAHLDRQIHGIHCSYLLGLEAADASGSSGCHVTLMSPYSSVFRQSIWGGIPVSLPAMSVFCFIFFWALWMTLTQRQDDRMATLFLVASTALPVLSSFYMGYLAMVTLKAACKLCVGIYLSSLIAFAAAFRHWYSENKRAPSRSADASSKSDKPLSFRGLAVAFVLGVLFVALPVVSFAASAPDFSGYIGKCGSLTHLGDADRVLVPIGPQGRSKQIIEVSDPLCGSCSAFARRLKATAIAKDISRRVLLFPLDDSCNWMISEAIHPGACALSEAVLCAGNDAETVLEWSFQEHESILEKTKRDPQAAAEMVATRFPELRRCIGSPSVRARLNLGLRWAVKNQLQVLTPQLFFEGARLCDEDTDLGLDYALPRLIALTGSDVSAAPVDVATQDRQPQPTTSVKRHSAKSPATAPSQAQPLKAEEPRAEEADRVDNSEMLDELVKRAKATGDETDESESQAPATGLKPSPRQANGDNASPMTVPPAASEQPAAEPIGASIPEQPEAL